MDKMNICKIVFAFMIIIFILLIQMPYQPNSIKEKVEEGRLYSFQKNEEYCCEITDFCVENKLIYILFGDKGILKIYKDDGSYLMSYAFDKSKGKARLREDGDGVYLFDQRRNCYVFSEGERIGFIKYNDYPSFAERLKTFVPPDEQHSNLEGQYYIKFASIYRRNVDGTNAIIIDRPLYYSFFQGIVPLASLASCLVVYGIFVILYKYAKK